MIGCKILNFLFDQNLASFFPIFVMQLSDVRFAIISIVTSLVFVFRGKMHVEVSFRFILRIMSHVFLTE